MSEKKGFFATLFGGGHSSGCCNMEIIEQPQTSPDHSAADAGQTVIQILGPNCRNCQALERNVKEALAAMGKDAVIEHVTDYGRISAYGVMSTPGLVVNEKLISCGKVLSAADLTETLQDLL